MLARTPNLADPTSKTPTQQRNELCKVMLKEGRGAAFSVQPASGVLAPFSSELVELTAYSDMWGHYTDTITFKVSVTVHVCED